MRWWNRYFKRQVTQTSIWPAFGLLLGLVVACAIIVAKVAPAPSLQTTLVMSNGLFAFAILALITNHLRASAHPLPGLRPATVKNNSYNLASYPQGFATALAAKAQPKNDSSFQSTPQEMSGSVNKNKEETPKAQSNPPASDSEANSPVPPTLSYQELLQNLCRQMIDVFPATACLIAGVDQTTQTLNLIHAHISTKQTNNQANSLSRELFPLPVAELPILQEAIKTQAPQTVRSNQPQPAPQETNLLTRWQFGAMVAVPLVNQNRVTAMLLLFSANVDAFTAKEIKLAQLLANQANIAIENARLFSQANRQLQIRVDELAGLQRVSSELNSTLDLDKILDLVLEEAMRVTQADFGNVYLYNVGTGNLVEYREQGWLDTVRPEGINPALASGDALAKAGIIGRALHSGNAILIPNVQEDEDFVDLGNNTRSEVVVPIYYAEEPVGVINLESRQRDFFNNNQLRYLEALANHAAIAIGNAQAYQQQKLEREQAGRRADQLARLSEISNTFRTNRPLHEVLEDIAYAIAESVGYDTVMVSLVQDTPPMLHHKVGAGIPIAQLKKLQTPAQATPLENLKEVMLSQFCISNSYFIPAEQMEVWQGKLNVPRIEKHRPRQSTGPAAQPENNRWQPGDLLLVPLADINDNIIGLLTVENPVSGLRPNLPAIQTLETFANHAAAAIENAQLFEREKQRRHLADTLRGVAEAISSQLEIEELLNIVLQELGHVVSYDSVNVQMLDEDQLVIIGGQGWEDSQKVLGLTFSMEGNNPNRLVIETQEPVVVKDAQKEYPDSFPPPIHHKIRSWLGVPLTYGTHVLGLMALDKHQVDFYTPDDVDVVLAFANQVAVALQNSRLFDEARQQVRQLAALTEVAQSINLALELDEVLNLVLDAVFDLVGHSKGSIWLIDNASNTVKIANTKNISDFLVELFNESHISVNSEPFASVIKSGRVLTIAGSAGKDEIAHYGLPFPNDVTYVPLKTEDGVIGILAIETVIHRKNMLELVTTLANLAAVAIDNARLLDDTRRRASEMQHLYNLGVEVSGMLDVRQVMRSVMNSALTLAESQVGAILFWDEEAGQYIIEGAAVTQKLVTQFGLAHAEWLEARFSRQNPLSLWSHFIRQIKETNQPIIANLAAAQKSQLGQAERVALRLGAQAILGVPIPVQNQINGAIFVASLTPRNFTAQEVQSLSLVANQASVAVRNAQLVQRLNQLTEELEERVALRTEELAQTLQDLTEERDRVGALYQIGRELSTSFDLDRVLTEALHLINRTIGISLGSILLLDPETENLIYRAAIGRDKPLPRGGILTRYKLGYGLAGKVMEAREPRLVKDLEQEPDWVPNQPLSDRRAAIAVPLTTGDEVLGALLLFHPEPGYFTEDHLKLVIAAGTQIAIAVNNAELYRLITDQAERLGVMYRQQATEAAKNQAILKGITDGVLVLDADRKIVLVNPKAAEILNINAADVENQPLQQILGRSGSPVELELTQLLYENLLKSLVEIEEGARSAQFRIEVRPKAMMVSLAPVALGAEELPSIVAVLRDISREAEIERLKNEFISTVSHELRTPMTSIKGYTELLLSGNAKVGELNPTQHRFVRIIQSNANRLTDLVNDILEISRIETGRIRLNLTSLDIIEIIKEVALSFEAQLAEKSLNFSLKLPERLPFVRADKARLTQILVNLIGNAWQYTPEGGNITVRAKVVGDYVQVDVEDSGIGIIEQDIEYIFDRFFRSERTEVQVVDGTGLGLSITKSFVDMLGGDIWVKSQIDKGSTFSFTVPQDSGQDDQISIDRLRLSAGPQVLIISDDKAVVSLLQAGLEDHGHQAIALGTGPAGLDLARKAGQNISLIVLDVGLNNADSLELLEQLKADETSANIPVLISSLSLDQSGECFNLQLIDNVATTFDESQVLDTVRQALSNARKNVLHPRLPGVKERENILIIESNRAISQWLKDILTEGHYQVQLAFNGPQALDMAMGSSPELILLSANMPRVDGQTLVAQLRRSPDTKEIPVVLITDKPVAPAENNAGIKILGREIWAKTGELISVDDLVAEILQFEAAALEE